MKSLLKKMIITICSAVMVMGTSLVGVNAAATADVGDFTVERSRSYSSYITKIKEYKGNGGNITLPEKAVFDTGEYTITTVGAAFTGNELITSVTIPEGYTDIDLNAFSGCTKLESVSIPGSMTSISASAFKGCPNLKTITFADDTASRLSLLNDVFADCTSLASIELPKRLSSVSNNFLRGCTALTTVSIADGAENFAVEDNILYDISGEGAEMVVYPFGRTETEYTIPAEVNGKTITATGAHLFRGNTVLKKITVPATVTKLWHFTFEGMTAIEEIVLEHEIAPELSSSVCTDMKAGSKVIVKNEDVKNAFESTSPYTTYYTADNTEIVIDGQTPEVKTVSASVSISAEPKIKDNEAIYNIYLDNAEKVNTILLKVSFDPTQVEEGSITVANETFTSGASSWDNENGELVLKAYMGITGNVTGFTSAEKTKLAEISVPLKNGAKGNITAEITFFKTAGVPVEDEETMNGEGTINNAKSSVFVPNYDVNGDGTVDIIDITEAQRYYKATSSDENWTKAEAMDVNGDNSVDIQDYIEIFNNLSDF